MNKSINKHQLEELVKKMVENPVIAQGYVKDSKETVTAFWTSLSKDLNTIGPPKKNVTEWKKCWNDQKRNVRKKASRYRREQIAAGGGLTKSIELCPTEEKILQTIGIKEAEGDRYSPSPKINNKFTVNISNLKKKKRTVNNIKTDMDTSDDCEVYMPESPTGFSLENKPLEVNCSNAVSSSYKRKRPDETHEVVKELIGAINNIAGNKLEKPSNNDAFYKFMESYLTQVNVENQNKIKMEAINLVAARVQEVIDKNI